MDKLEIINQILSETYIIESAIEVKDVDIVLSALDNRGKLICEFELLKSERNTTTIEEKIDLFNEINKRCMNQLKRLKKELEVEASEVSSEKKKTVRRQKVHESYLNPYLGDSGSRFDLKK